jgi:hypothetical protein
VFAKLSLWNWRQFGNVELAFHERLTVLTGANGAGKTTMLNILSQHFGWRFLFMSEPVMDRKGALRYFSGSGGSVAPEEARRQVGLLVYSDGHESPVSVPTEVSANYDVTIDSRREQPGLFLPSHRPAYSYQAVTDIPTQVDAREQLFEQYLSNLRNFWVSNSRIESPSLRLKRSLISLATFGYGNEAVEANPEARETFEGFQDVLSILLPDHIGFQRLRIRSPEVVLETAAGSFSLDGASGGVAALIDLAWQMFMRSILEGRDKPFVVVADEPENHLHPALQREVMPKLLEAFPGAQFIVATHNPFVVGSVRDSSVYALRFDGDRVFADQLDLSDKAGSADDVLREVLGVPVPLPIWVEDLVEQLVSAEDPANVSSSTIARLRDGLNQAGAGRQLTLALDQLLSEHAEADEG